MVQHINKSLIRKSKKLSISVLLLLCAVACLSLSNCLNKASYAAIEAPEEEEKKEEPEIGAYLDPCNLPANCRIGQGLWVSPAGASLGPFPSQEHS